MRMQETPPWPTRSLPPECTPEWTPEAISKRTARHQRLAYDEGAPQSFTVLEVATDEHREQTWKLHSKKEAFANDHEHLKARIFDNKGAKVKCRSWLLAIDAGQAGGADVCLAAVTVRLNPYFNRAGTAWAQVMNLSVCEERKGYGTCLVAGVEELLWREGVDVVVLYPVDNNRAANFWCSLGFAERRESLLPPEELDAANGALLPEGYMKGEEKVMLPRWEMSLIEHRAQRRMIHDEDEDWKALAREQWPLWRKVAAVLCKLGGAELSQRLQAAQTQRERERERKPWL